MCLCAGEQKGVRPKMSQWSPGILKLLLWDFSPYFYISRNFDKKGKFSFRDAELNPALNLSSR